MKTLKTILVCTIMICTPLPAMAASQAGARAREYFRYALLPHLWDDTKKTFTDPENLIWLGAGAGLTVIAHQYDWQVDDYWKDHKMAYGMATWGNDLFGAGEYQALLALTMTFSGWHFENEKLANAGEVLAEAQIIQGVIINVIKPIANKERPDGSDNLSFPSGHTGTAFCTAAVLHDRYGWKLGVPAYTAAVITALARQDVHKHWVSDTVMGAAIAMVTGYGVSRVHDDYPYDVRWGKKEQPQVMIVPEIGADGYGLVLAMAW